MGGGFMADNKDMSMLQQKPPPQQQQQHHHHQFHHQFLHHHRQEEQNHHHHHHQNSLHSLHRSPSVASSSSSSPPFFPRPAPFLRPSLPPNPNLNPPSVSADPAAISHPPRSTSPNSSKSQRKKPLKFILKVPNSNPNPNCSSPSASASPSHSSSSSSPSPSPSPSSSPPFRTASDHHGSFANHQIHLHSKPPQPPRIIHRQSDPSDLNSGLINFHQQQQEQHQSRSHQSIPDWNRQQHLTSHPVVRINPRQLHDPSSSQHRTSSQSAGQHHHSQVRISSKRENLEQQHHNHNHNHNQEEEGEEELYEGQGDHPDQFLSPNAKRLKLHQDQTSSQIHSHSHNLQQQALSKTTITATTGHISSNPVKKLPQSPSAHQGAHGMSQSPKIPVLPVPYPLPLSSTPASVQSSPSLSVAVSSDDAQKPSKKRKLRSLVESTESHVVQTQDCTAPAQAASRPYLTPLVDAKPQLESDGDKDPSAATACSSPRLAAAQSHFVPAKKLLKGILDRLQKKDKFGVFAEPVDADEVPNYYDVIKEPMDFGTMRKRIMAGYYTSLDPFQSDIFLICNNAMRYNAKGTVYYRHARAIKDVADKILEELKKSGPSMEMVDDFIGKQKSGGAYTKKSHKKQNGAKSLLDRVALDHASGVTLASGGDFERHGSSLYADSPGDEDAAGYFLRSSGLRSQSSDDNRRSSYKPSSSLQGCDPLLTTVCGESPQFVPTGYATDFPYARSLARFASDLGPLVWKVAAEKIRRALPPGIPFGPGWVVEREAPGGNFPSPAGKQRPQGQPGGVLSNNSLSQESLLKVNHQSTLVSDGLCNVKPATSNGSVVNNHRSIQENSPSVNPVSNAQSTCRSVGESATYDNVKIQSGGVPNVGSDNVENLSKLNYQSSKQSTGQIRPTNSTESAPNNAVFVPEGSPRFPKQLQNVGSSGQHIRMPVNLNGSTDTNAATQVNSNHPSNAQFRGWVNMNDSNPLAMRKFTLNQETMSSQEAAASSGIPVNLNHPACLSPEERESTDIKPKEKENGTENVTNGNSRLMFDGFLSGKGANTNMSSMSSKFDQVNDSAIEISSNTLKSSSMNLLDSKSISHSTIINSMNGNQRSQSNSSAFDADNRMPFYQEKTELARVPADVLKARSAQLSKNMSREVNSFGPIQPTYGLPSRAVQPAHWSSSTPNLNMPPQPSDRDLVERLRGFEANDMERLNPGSRTISSMHNTMAVNKGINVGRSFMAEPKNAENCNAPDRDQAHEKPVVTTQVPSSTKVSPLSPTSNGNSSIHDDQSMPTFLPVAGTGGVNVQSQLLRGSDQNQQVQNNAFQNSQFRLLSLQQQQAFKDAQLLPYGNMPHFLQYLHPNNNSHLTPQLQRMQLQIQNNSVQLANEHAVSSEVCDPKLSRSLSNAAVGKPESGNPVWQYMAPNSQSLLQQVSKHPVSTAPDLNVSLPPMRSPFDQPNGSEKQQPDLALQL